MSLSNVHPVEANYEALRFTILSVLEGNKALPYYDTKGHPTIGIGLNLDVPDVRHAVYQQMLIPEDLWTSLDAIIAAPTIRNLSATHAGNAPSERDVALQVSLSAFLNASTVHRSFALTPSESESLFTSEANAREAAVFQSVAVPTGSLEMIGVPRI
jgi:hypothetical protein